MCLEAHPIDPGMLLCCNSADNNDSSHDENPNHQSFVKSSISANDIKKSFQPGK